MNLYPYRVKINHVPDYYWGGGARWSVEFYKNGTFRGGVPAKSWPEALEKALEWISAQYGWTEERSRMRVQRGLREWQPLDGPPVGWDRG